MAAIDPQPITTAAACYECQIPLGDVWYVILGALVNLDNGDPVPTDAQDLVEQAKCLESCIPKGYLPYAILEAACAVTLGPVVVAAKYFNGAVNDQWDTLGNWWGDAAHTQPATALPVAGADVFIEADVTTGPAAPVALNSVTCSGTALFSVSNVTATLFTFNDSSDCATNLNGAAVFNNTSFASTCDFASTATFNNASFVDVGAVCTFNGDAVFNNTANQKGTATFNANVTFNNTSRTTGTSIAAFSAATFNGGSSNDNILTGDAVFNNTAHNSTGSTISGNAIFNDSSENRGGATVSGTGTFNDTSTNVHLGVVAGTATFNDSSTNAGNCSSTADFYNTSTCTGGTLGGIALFHDSSTLNGNVTGTSGFSFIDSSVIASGTLTSIAASTMAGTSSITGTVTLPNGGMTFSGNSFVAVTAVVTATTDTTFQDSAHVDGSFVTAGWNLDFYVTSSCSGSITGDAHFHGFSALLSGASITGSVIFSDSSSSDCNVTIGAAITWTSLSVEPGTGDPPAASLVDNGNQTWTPDYNGFTAGADTHVDLKAQVNGGGYVSYAAGTPVGGSPGDSISAYQIDKCAAFNVNSADPPGAGSISSITLT